jgi:hypothetical protein
MKKILGKDQISREAIAGAQKIPTENHILDS